MLYTPSGGVHLLFLKGSPLECLKKGMLKKEAKTQKLKKGGGNRTIFGPLPLYTNSKLS